MLVVGGDYKVGMGLNWSISMLNFMKWPCFPDLFFGVYGQLHGEMLWKLIHLVSANMCLKHVKNPWYCLHYFHTSVVEQFLMPIPTRT